MIVDDLEYNNNNLYPQLNPYAQNQVNSNIFVSPPYPKNSSISPITDIPKQKAATFNTKTSLIERYNSTEQ